MAQNRRRWNNLFEVEADFKRRQIVRVLGFSGIYVALSTLVLAFFYTHVLHPGLVGPRPLSLDLSAYTEIWQEIPGLRRTVVAWASAMTGLSCLFSVAIGLHFSHKMAGPLYRFKEELRRLREGQDIRPITLRAGDDFEDIAEMLNGALQTLSSREQGLRRHFESTEELEGLRGVLSELGARLDRYDADPGEPAALARDLRDLMDKTA